MGIPPSWSYCLRSKSNPLTTCIFVGPISKSVVGETFKTTRNIWLSNFAVLINFNTSVSRSSPALPYPLGFKKSGNPFPLRQSSSSHVYFNPVTKSCSLSPGSPASNNSNRICVKREWFRPGKKKKDSVILSAVIPFAKYPVPRRIISRELILGTRPQKRAWSRKL